MKPFLIILLLSSSTIFSDTLTKEGKITEVILYRNQALVTRVIDLDLKEGSHELIVPNLPSQIIPNSLYSESQTADVRAARIKTLETKEDSDPKLNQLNDKLEKISISILRVNKLLDVNRKKVAFLTKQEDFTASTEKIELNRGVLQPNVIKEITMFNFEQRKELAIEELLLENELKTINKEKDLVAREIKQLAKTTLKNSEASIFLDKQGSGKTEIKLFYLVQNANWSPVYNFYSKLGSKTVKVEFNARIQQVSGENWEGVSLTLSNATPTLSAIAPGLSPFRLSLTQQNPGSTNYDVRSATKGVANKLSSAQARNLSSQSWKETQDSSWEMNSAANEYQNLEFLAKEEELNVLRTETKAELSSPNVTYTMKSKLSLQSKTDQQLIKVEKFDLPAKFYNVSIPLLTSYVYKEAEIENDGIENLLEGQVTSYLDDRFVGKGEISNIARGQSFVMGFGTDPQIRVRRDLYDKKEKILGGNKELILKVKIQFENFYKKPVEVRVLDRIPVEDEKENIRITLDLKNNSLSSDEVYIQNERPKGILRWDTTIPAESSGAKMKTIEYIYKIEFDKNLQVTLPTSSKTEQMRMEFDEIQKIKFKK
ncbi:MAG: DUF4139 domain-containing protein [Leptospiraceae bacterium]|nr:DUF4139 domain-containing protein [Leptospiraceae bacterium]